MIFFTPKWCTHVHCLVLKNNPNDVIFFIFFYEDDIQLQIQVPPGRNYISQQELPRYFAFYILSFDIWRLLIELVIWRADFRKGLNPLLVEIELLMEYGRVSKTAYLYTKFMVLAYSVYKVMVLGNFQNFTEFLDFWTILTVCVI